MELLFWTSLGLIFYIYFGYFLLIFLISRFYPEPEFAEMTELPRISMIIAAYNEEKVIEEKIKNCLALDYPPELLEILIGSDGSNDKTGEILSGIKDPRVTVCIYNKRNGKNWIVNKLVDKSAGKILVFSDANIMFETPALKNLLKPFKNSSVGAVNGKLILLSEGISRYQSTEQKYWTVENRLRKNESKIGTTFGVTGAIYAIRRKDFQVLPSDISVSDDTYTNMLIMKNGYKIVYSDKSVAFEEVLDDLFLEMKRRIRICARNLNGIRFFKSLLHPKNGYVALGVWSHKILRWFAPFPLITVFLSTIFLLDKPMYQWVFVLEVAVAAFALLGIILNLLNIKIKFLSYPMYFFVINFGLLIGIFKFLFGLQKPYWEPTARP